MRYKYIEENVSDMSITWGGRYTDPRGVLTDGEEYEVNDIDEHTWHTRVYLEGFPNTIFNSVWFDEIKEDI